MEKMISKKLKIGQKLIMINLVTTGAALLLVGAVLTATVLGSLKDSLIYNLIAQAKILAENSTAPLTFNDQKAAEETLNALKASHGIDCAIIYGKDGKVFADYCRDDAEKNIIPAAPGGDSHFFADDHLHIFQGIVLDKERIGSIYIRSDLKKLNSLMMEYGIAAAATMVIVFILGFILLSRLQKTITEPIIDLTHVMNLVSLSKNYYLKANIYSGDEIGSLAKGFNEMLDQIQERDAKLRVEIGERKKAEEVVRTLNDALELKVEERTGQLLEAQEELVRNEKLAMLGLIAGGMGNELRNPLGVMNNAVFFLKSVLPDADETVREYLDIIKQEIDNSQGIISDLLDYYLVSAPRTKAVPVHELIKQAVGACALPESVRMRTDLPEPPLLAWIDPKQMGQVLRNLINNAVQAMPNGGTLHVAVRRILNSELRIMNSKFKIQNSEFDGDFIEIRVEDTGTGIAQEHMDRLFQPLFTTKSRGIGLGLAFSKKLAEANGGRIEVESRLGEGTAFTVTVPADMNGATGKEEGAG